MKYIALGLIAVGALFALSDRAGTYSFPFVKQLESARSEAMGGAGAFLFDGSPIDNPAQWGFLQASDVRCSYKNLWSDEQGGVLSYSRPLNDIVALGSYLYYVSYGSVVRTDEQGNALGTMTPGDIVLSVGGGRRFGKYLSLGGTAHFLYESAGDLAASGVAFDGGLLYQNYRRKLCGGLVVKNIGFQLSSFGDETSPVAYSIEAGGSARLPGLPVNLALSGNYFGDDGLSFAAGLEIVAFKPFYPRIGYRTTAKLLDPAWSDEDKLKGLSAGFRLDIKRFTVDYAFSHYGILGYVHHLSVGYSL